MQYGNIEPERTIIFSHGNGEDLEFGILFKVFWINSTEMIAYDYPGYGLPRENQAKGCFDAKEAVYNKVIEDFEKIRRI